MNTMIAPWATNGKISGPKHQTKVWQYGNTEWAISCTCGFNQAPVMQDEAEALIHNHTLPSFKATQEEILVTSKGDEVKITMTDAEAVKILARENDRRLDARRSINTFADSLCLQFGTRGKLSDVQRSWLHKMANETVERTSTPKPEPRLSEQTFPRLVEMLQHAQTHLKHPRILVGMDQGTIRLNIAGSRAKVPGSLNVTSDGTFESRTWYGRIHPDSGQFEASRSCPSWVVEALVEFNADPAKAAAVQGQRYGHCCFCSRELITTESVTVGYGPICADKYGLPWG